MKINILTFALDQVQWHEGDASAAFTFQPCYGLLCVAIIGDHDVLCRTAQCIFNGHQIITWNVQQLENGPLNALQTVLFFCTQHLLHPLIIPFATGFKFFQCLQTTFRLHELLNSLLLLLLLPL